MPGLAGVGLGGRVVHGAGGDASGLLQFGSSPASAPVVHLGGPWQVTFFSRQRLTVGRESLLELGMGTTGLGAGTTAFVGHEELVPPHVYPRAEITYPARRNGESPLKENHDLKDRC
jgi:hypothetical protein